MAGALANRYAGALADVVFRPGAGLGPETTRAELAGFVEALETSPELRNVLVSPSVPPAKKKAVIGQLSARLGLHRAMQNFLCVVIDHRRVPLLGDMLSAFQTLLDERRGIVRVQVSSARLIDQDQEALLAGGLGRLTGKQVRLEFSVDPTLLGGLVARIGSTVYDGSVRGRLHALQRRLSAE